MTGTQDIERLLRRSFELHEAVDRRLAGATFGEGAHANVTLSTAQISREHAASVCGLVEAGHVVSALVLLRAQLEATVRVAWLLYAATEEWVSNYLEAARLTPDKAPKAPGMDSMLDDIGKRASEGAAPPAVAPQLRSFKDGAWNTLNSFVHSGIHPVVIQAIGIPPDFREDTLRNANGLLLVNSMLVAVLSGSQDLAKQINHIQKDFLDCCPPTVK